MQKAWSATDILFGLSIGDAIGVPVEFTDRDQLKYNPVTGLQGYGTWNQPPGTWSDDTSLSLCLAETLLNEFEPETIASGMLRWFRDNHWTATGVVFDVGITTRNALLRLARGISHENSGETGEDSNGNGSLMRILPLLCHTLRQNESERFHAIAVTSSITHAHPWSVSSCYYYMEYARLLTDGLEKMEAFQQLNQQLATAPPSGFTPKPLTRILTGKLQGLESHQIKSSGYVVDTLEAALWCFLNSDSYTTAVLNAVNLGNDTDTCGCVTGGLAGLYYGKAGIPESWIREIARADDIEALGIKLDKRYGLGSFNK